MELTKEEVKQLVKYLSKQFIDLNSKKLYDGMVIHGFIKRAYDYLGELERIDNE